MRIFLQTLKKEEIQQENRSALKRRGFLVLVAKFDIYLILLFALLLRLIKLGHAYYGTISELFRDLIILFDAWEGREWLLAGPPASVGGLNFGPIYYYLLAPLFYGFRFHPAGAILTSTIFSVLSIFLAFKLMALWFDRKAGLWAALFMGLAIFDIQNAYYISNPNLLPFFVLLFFYGLSMWLRGQQSWKAGVCLGLGLGVATQLHPTGLVLLPLIFLCAVVFKRPKLKASFLIAAGSTILLTYIPYLIFELQNQFHDLRRMMSLGSSSYGFPAVDSFVAVVRFWDSLFFFKNDFLNLLIINRPLYFSLLPFYLLIPFLIWWQWRRLRRQESYSVIPSAEGKFLLTAWLILGTAVFVFYRGNIPPFYFLVLWPVPVILLVWLIRWLLINRSRFLVGFILSVFVATQVVQLVYFYGLVDRPEFDHRRLLSFFRQIADDAGPHTLNVINATDHVNLFIYYLRLSGLYHSVQPKAEILYLVYNTGDREVLTPNPKRYGFLKSFTNGEFTVTKYQLIK